MNGGNQQTSLNKQSGKGTTPSDDQNGNKLQESTQSVSNVDLKMDQNSVNNGKGTTPNAKDQNALDGESVAAEEQAETGVEAGSDNLSIKMITDHFSPDKQMIPFKHLSGGQTPQSIGGADSLTSETPVNSAALAALDSASPGAHADSKVRALKDLTQEINQLRNLLESNPSSITNTVP